MFAKTQSAMLMALTLACLNCKALAVVSLPDCAPAAMQIRCRQLPPGFLSVTGNVSKSFIAEIENDAQELPKACVQALAKAGFQIQLSHTVTEAVPAARNQQVRGYEAHSTWDSVFAMFNRTTCKVVMAEYALPDPVNGGTNVLGGLSRLEDTQRRKGILRHEFGHAVDNYLGNFSHGAGFLAVYKEERENVKDADDRKLLDYYLQAGDAGPEETFAELFACLEKIACDRASDEALRRYFPRAQRLVREAIASLNRHDWQEPNARNKARKSARKSS